jgi:LysM repeat protein/predicted nucleic acid-binding Zn ribbon protein
MTDQTKEPSVKRQVCPICGTRVRENATHCEVCGTVLQTASRRGSRRTPAQITLTLPLALALLVIFSLLAAGLTYAATRFIGDGRDLASSETPTSTPTKTYTPEPIATETNIPPPTPLPTLEYTIVTGDTCLGIAVYHNVSVQSIRNLNPGLVCEVLSVGQKINVPQPTPTSSPEPTATLPPSEATFAACETVTYKVQANDTLGGIAQNYNVNMRAVMDYNGMTSETVYLGQVLIIPLCERLPTPGPSPTATLPPPYPAPNLLLPQDGSAFTLADDTVTLQWSSVGELRENEAYRIIVEDITEGSGTVRLMDTVTDTKYIIPTSFRPNEPIPHVMRWWVQVVRQIGTTLAGEPNYRSAGEISLKRDFTWSGAAPGATPTP